MSDLDWDILTAITQHIRVAMDYSFQYDERMFVDEKAKKLGKAVIDYVKTYKSKPTKRAIVERNSSDAALKQIAEDFWSDQKSYDQSDYNFDLDRLKKRYSDILVDRISNLSGDKYDDSAQKIKQIQKQISEFKSINTQSAFARKTAKEYISEFTKEYIAKSENPDLGRGILTGYSFFDYIKNGLRPSDLIILAGQTGAGKSFFLNNMAIQIWLQNNRINTPKNEFGKGYNVTYFSLEMPYADCFRRTMARLADVPTYSLRDATLTRAEAQAVKQSCQFIKHYPYAFDIIDVPRGFSPDQLELMYDEIKADYQPDVIFIDYMGLMEVKDANNADDWLNLGMLAGKIHEFARTYEIPVVTAVQLNRMEPKKNQSEEKAIGLHRIGRSSLIAHHATAIIQIETRIDEHTHDDFIYHIIKNRDGEDNCKHSIWKNFANASITDKPFNIKEMSEWSESEDISEDVSDILGLMDE